ncbi:sigma 54-interacting transcriptional regulator [Anaerospora hongkongensis]|uniref:sigma 54-interacting transcriptional regulator n=1 Tax=Anaerospora hongkongensis TaxID=244830 RepID=UPI002899E83C|nr:sigma 54-interacting transcriptional regulator [Anaerospora hongkongensis]
MEPKIGIISPSSTLTQLIQKNIEEKGLAFAIRQASQEDALEAAKELIAKGVAVIISRGNTARMLRSQLNIPIVDIQHTFFDCFSCYQKARQISSKIAFLATSEGYMNILTKSKPFLEDALIFPINPLLGAEATEEKLNELASLGIEVAIGGLSLKKAVLKRNIQYLMTTADQDAIDDAILTAIHFLKIEEEKIRKGLELQSRYELTRAILNCVSEGIISIDHKGIVTNMNGEVSRYFETLRYGQTIDSVIRKSYFADVLAKGESIRGALLSTGKHSLIISIDPIKLEQNVIGAVITLQKQTEIQNIEHKMRRVLAQKHSADKTFADIVGSSPAIQAAKKLALKYASVDSTVIIVGGTGTGKEMFAQSIHNASGRRHAPFVAINCAAFPSSVLESELFGYVKGAFTGALNEGKPGIFELAHKGTIFLDEISETPLDVQLKLLRVIQERKVIRIGDDKVTPVDIRIITASNKNLNDLVKQGVFREDFYYRLCVLKLRLPALNERREDIPELTRCFLNQANLHPCSITEEALELLASGEWRGNIRQLSNIVERLAVMCDNGIIDKKLVLEVADDIAMPSGDHLAESLSAAADNGNLTEKEFIRRALSKMNGNKAAAAKQLGISTTTLWRKMKKIIENEPYYFDLIRYKK